MFDHALIYGVSPDHHHKFHCTGNVPQTWPPSGHKCNLSVAKMKWDLEHGRMNIWCEFEEEWLKTLLFRVRIVKSEVGPLVATNVINWWRQCTGVQTMAQ